MEEHTLTLPRVHPLAKAAIENPKAYHKIVKRKFYQPGLDPGALSQRERYCVRAAVLFAESFFQATTGINLHMYYSPEDRFPLWTKPAYGRPCRSNPLGEHIQGIGPYTAEEVSQHQTFC